MENKDLTREEMNTLRICRRFPHLKWDGRILFVMNVLCSYGLLIFCGNMKFCVSENGHELLQGDLTCGKKL